MVAPQPSEKGNVMTVAKKFERLAQPVLWPGEYVVASAVLTKRGYTWRSTMAALPAIGVFPVANAMHVGLILTALAGGIVAGALSFVAQLILVSADQSRIKNLAMQGVALSTTMVWVVTPSRLLVWATSPITGSVHELQAIYPLNALRVVTEPTSKSTWPKARIAIGAIPFDIEFRARDQLEPMITTIRWATTPTATPAVLWTGSR